MKIIYMALNEIKTSSRNRASFLLLMVLPVFMIFLMGNALAGIFNSNKGIDRFPVLYVNEDSGTIGRAFDSFMKNGADKFLYTISGDCETAEKQVLSGEYTNAVIVPKDLSQKVERGEKVSINVISSGKDRIRDYITASLVESFTNHTMTQLGVMKVYCDYSGSMDPSDVSTSISKVQDSIGNSFVEPFDAEIPPAKKLTSFQYFTASMLLFFMLMTGMGVGSGIVEDREKSLHKRISSYPVKDWQYLIAKILGNMIIAIMQVIIVVVFTRFVFKVDWGSSLLGIGAVIVLMMLISSSIGLLFSSLVNTSKAVSAGMTVVIWMIAFLGGGFTPVPALEPVGRFTFYKWGVDSLANFMVGGGLIGALDNLVMLIVLAIVLWAAGIVLYRRRGCNE